MLARWALLLVAILLPSSCAAETAPERLRAVDRVSYSLGHQIGGDLERQAAAIDAEALLQGLRDGLAGTAPILSEEEMNAILLGVKRKIEATPPERRPQTAARLRSEGREFLAANAKREGVVELPSGLQYRVLEQGKGRHPLPEDEVSVRYRGSLIDGSVFHDSGRRGDAAETFVVSGVVPGMAEALELMQQGSRWQIFVPANLAYGRRGPLADRTVIYEIELLAIEPGR